MNADKHTPTVSRVLDDGGLVELLYDPVARTTALAVVQQDGTVDREASLDMPSGERLVPYSPQNNLITSGCVMLPADIGEFGDKGDLVERIRGFLHRYVDLSPTFEEIAAHYVLLTWVYDRFNDLPYLRLRGSYGSGKTRALLTLGSIAYKAFFASGASTVSPIFHIQDAFQGTLILDEADYRFSDTTAELTKILNNGTTKGLPVLRTMTNRHKELNPTAFRVFGPKVIAMRESFSDQALESRFITEHMKAGRPRSDIPVHLPASFPDEARALRNELLGFRLRHFHSVAPDPARLPADLSPRAMQMALPLLSVIDDEAVRKQVCRLLREADAERSEMAAQAPDALLVRALEGAASEIPTGNIPVAAVARWMNALSTVPLELSMSCKSVGWMIRTRLRIDTRKSGGVYVIPAEERARVRTACANTLGHQSV